MNQICHCTRLSLLPLICPLIRRSHPSARTHLHKHIINYACEQTCSQMSDKHFLNNSKFYCLAPTYYFLTLFSLRVWVQHQNISKLQTWD